MSAGITTPLRIPVNVAGIPDELRALPQWVLWRYETRDGKPTKVPYSAQTGERASATDPATWSPFPEVRQTWERGGWAGVGFVFTGTDPYVGIDLDGCRDPQTEDIEPWARAILAELDTYADASPSGTGLHLICRGKLPPGRRRQDRVEMYDDARYFAMTGVRIGGNAGVEERQGALDKHYRETFPAAPEAPARPPSAPNPPSGDLTDGALLELARDAANGDKFQRLWKGDTSEHGEDDSAADLALCSLLAFWTNGNASQMDRLFRQSGLMRAKWDSRRGKSTYGVNTMSKAIENCREYYTPVRRQEASLTGNNGAVHLGPDPEPGSSRNPFARGIIRASELPDATEPPRLWFGIYRGTVSLLIGETGAGKSSLLYNISVAAARNEDLWRIPFGMNRPLNVLHIDPENAGNWEEGHGGICALRLERIQQGKPPCLAFHDGQGVNLADPEQMDFLREYILAHQIDLCIIDPIANLFSTVDENDNAEAARQMKALVRLSRQTMAAIIPCHHSGKEGSSMYGRGASARLASADVGMVFRARGETEEVDDDYDGEPLQRDDPCRLQVVKNRWEGRASLFLKMEGNDRFGRVRFADWRATSGTTNRANKGELCVEEIRLYLMDGEWHGRDEIIDRMKREGYGRNTADAALQELATDPDIERNVGNRGKADYRMRSPVKDMSVPFTLPGIGE